MLQAVSDRLRIAYDDLGYGDPAMLLLPGWCVDRTIFSDLAARLAEHHRTLWLDWRGHGQSDPAGEDFGTEELVRDALAVIRDSGADNVIPVALSHAGWVAVELRRRLGSRVPGLVLLDWLVVEPQPPFRQTLRDLQSPELWQQTLAQLLEDWQAGTDNDRIEQALHEVMGGYGQEMWSRAAREVAAAYSQAVSPLKLLSAMDPPPPVLHLFSQPPDEWYIAVQERFAAGHPWFRVRKLNARTHMVPLEAPDEIADAIEQSIKDRLYLPAAGLSHAD